MTNKEIYVSKTFLMLSIASILEYLKWKSFQ